MERLPPLHEEGGGVTKPRMVMRSHRYPRKLYEAAMAKAVEREENLSDVLREALERYVKDDQGVG